MEAVKGGCFHIWTAAEVDDALGLLTGLPVGAPDAIGVYPEGTLHRLVFQRLARWEETLKALSGKEEEPA